ncbi:MAG: DUF1467 family protein, partial [Alphaproteobacteria bacterium]|nr:DUF1467 family protein [Alphaproteobacteria bacterium]
PWGATKLKAPLPGQALSAPENPRIGFKFLITTLIAAAIWGMLFFYFQ